MRRILFLLILAAPASAQMGGAQSPACEEDAKAACEECCKKRAAKVYRNICEEICQNCGGKENCECPKCPVKCPELEGEPPERPEKKKKKKQHAGVPQACDQKSACQEAASLQLALASGPEELAEACVKALDQCYEGLREAAAREAAGGVAMSAGEGAAAPAGGVAMAEPELDPCSPRKLCKKLFEESKFSGQEALAMAEACDEALKACVSETQEQEQPPAMAAGGGGGGPAAQAPGIVAMAPEVPQKPPPPPRTSARHPDHVGSRMERECELFAKAWAKEDMEEKGSLSLPDPEEQYLALDEAGKEELEPEGFEEKKTRCVEVTISAAPECCDCDFDGGACGRAACEHAARVTGKPELLAHAEKPELFGVYGDWRVPLGGDGKMMDPETYRKRYWAAHGGKAPGEIREMPPELYAKLHQAKQAENLRFAARDGKLFLLKDFDQAASKEEYRWMYQLFIQGMGIDPKGVMTPEEYAQGEVQIKVEGPRFALVGGKAVPLKGDRGMPKPEEHRALLQSLEGRPEALLAPKEYESFYRLMNARFIERDGKAVPVRSDGTALTPREYQEEYRSLEAQPWAKPLGLVSPEDYQKTYASLESKPAKLKAMAQALKREFSPSPERVAAFSVLSPQAGAKRLGQANRSCARSLARMASEDEAAATEGARAFLGPDCSLFSARALGQKDDELAALQLLKAGKGGKAAESFDSLLKTLERGKGSSPALRAARQLARPSHEARLSDWAARAGTPGKGLVLLASAALGLPQGVNLFSAKKARDWDELKEAVKKFGLADQAVAGLLQEARKPGKNLTPSAVQEALSLCARGEAFSGKWLSEGRLFSECAEKVARGIKGYQGSALDSLDLGVPDSDLHGFLGKNPGASPRSLAEQNLKCAQGYAGMEAGEALAAPEAYSERIWFTWRLSGALLHTGEKEKRKECVERYDQELGTLPAEPDEVCLDVCGLLKKAASLFPEGQTDLEAGRKVCQESCPRQGSGKKGRISGAHAAQELIGGLSVLEEKQHPGFLRRWKGRIKGLEKDKEWHKELVDALLLPFHSGIDLREAKKEALKAAVELRP